MDNSFLTLHETLTEASNIGNPRMANIVNFCPIQLLPDTAYVQTTASAINLGMDYEVFIIDCDGNELSDITQYVAVNQQDNFIFEIAPLSFLSLDFYRKPLHLKFTHPPSGQEFYSNKFYLTQYEDRATTTFYYKNVIQTNDDSLMPFDAYNSITVNAMFVKVEPEKQFTTYKQVGNDNEISSLPHTYEKLRYNFDKWDNKTLRSMIYMFNSTRVYIQDDFGKYSRVTANAVIESEDVEGATNIFKGTFVVSVDYSDRYTPTYQIFEDFALIDKYPFGVYRSDDVPVILAGAFNYPITLGTGFVTILDGDGNVIIDYPETAIMVDGNTFTIDISALGLANGDYYINFTSGLFISPLGQTYSILEDSDEGNEWPFTITDGDYDIVDDYDEPDYI